MSTFIINSSERLLKWELKILISQSEESKYLVKFFLIKSF